MKKHIKLEPSKTLLNYRAVLPPVPKKTFSVDKDVQYNKIKSAFDSAIINSKVSLENASTILGAENTPVNVLLSIKENIDNPARLKLDSLDTKHIELLSVNKIDGVVTANISLPLENIKNFSEKITQYGYELSSSNRPKNQALIESISDISSTSIKELWFSTKPLPKDKNSILNFELWFSSKESSVTEIECKIEIANRAISLTVRNGCITFKDRVVKIVTGTIEQLENFQSLTNLIVEVRPAATVCSDYLSAPVSEQLSWQRNLKYTVSPHAVPICILDTGVNIGHPLLIPISAPESQVLYNPNWLSGDQSGHGTWMAGASVLGDLKHLLNNSSIEITGTIESGKIISSCTNNDPDLYGLITSDVVYLIDSIKPSNNRIYTLATTSNDYSLLGSPSSWSAKVDELASETPDDSIRRLFIVSAGNLLLNSPRDIPVTNQNSTIQEPANAYNALTVGYWSSEALLNQSGYELFCELSDIGPTSTSSHSWHKSSPLKPEVIFEGGNFGYDPVLDFSSEFEDLSILAASHDFSNGDYFSYFGETSAATALATHFTSKVWSTYPDYWPETIRALVVHSAEWPEKLKSRFSPFKNKSDIESLLRLGGYGYPSLTKALQSGDRNVNLIIEDTIQPYTSDGKMNKMALYLLPWPSNELSKLDDVPVKLKVTLSYFIEPNPGERGWINKYKYCSHGLRFELNSAEENKEEFTSRINKKYRNDNPGVDKTESDSTKWLLGQKLRSNGSIHSDTWVGTARELSEKKYLAIYPVSGWWKELKSENRQSSVAKYSLIVSIETPENNLEIYNEIENLVNIKTAILNEIEI
ncbi:S8 family peptidase [Shewanella baltica]|uniref:S8 family peptidase n=1 Tax=Shewanella baltica TaxID=62322 RepID=UPI00217E3F75|nr:S8 family peptidase [Shewanella baltica]MCS6133982.1 S8 family peptidase [Shewanella baltica]